MSQTQVTFMFQLQKEIDTLEITDGRVMKLFAVIPQAKLGYVLLVFFRFLRFKFTLIYIYF
jgi:hypothetical protein